MTEMFLSETSTCPLSLFVRAERLQRGLTQTQLAQKSGYSLATIFRLEHGMMNLTLECLEDVLGALGFKLVLGVERKEAGDDSD